MNNNTHLEKTRRWKDNGCFGGNREIVLKRDNYKCVVCGMTNEQHKIKFNRSVSVHHIDGKGVYSKIKNHSIDNMETLCLPCHTRKDNLRTGARPISKYNKLTKNDCKDIIINSKNMNISSLAKKYGVSRMAIYLVKQGKIHHRGNEQ
jgi:5-methylcytosine-specific restriction endonuclease McrA